MYVSAFETSACGMQWMRFEPDSPVDPLIRTVPHIAFQVDDLQAAIQGQEILTPPNSPSGGVMVAMILDNGAPVRSVSGGTAQGRPPPEQEEVAAAQAAPVGHENPVEKPLYGVPQTYASNVDRFAMWTARQKHSLPRPPAMRRKENRPYYRKPACRARFRPLTSYVDRAPAGHGC
jgi:hypothetical protein